MRAVHASSSRAEAAARRDGARAGARGAALALLLAAAGFAPSASAQEDWRFALSGYMWLPRTTTDLHTRFGTVSTDLSARDALDALDFGYMVAGTAHRGRWMLALDVIHMQLTLDHSTPFDRLFSRAETEVRLTALSGYGFYRVTEAAPVEVHLGGGLRMMSSDIDLTLKGVERPDHWASVDESWVDPVVAVRIAAGEGKWRGSLHLDAGGFGIGEASRSTWQAIGLVTYAWNERWSASAGYRHLYFDRDNHRPAYDLELTGPLLGVTWHF